MKKRGFSVFLILCVFLCTAFGQQCIYWGDKSTGIYRANLDGSNVIQLVDMTSIYDLEIDTINNKMYWTTSSRVYRSNLDGSDKEELIPSDYTHRYDGLALDIPRGKMYLCRLEGPNSSIVKANIDGSMLEDLIILEPRSESPRDIEVDSVNGKIFWSNNGYGGIKKASLDGTTVEQVTPFYGFDIACGLSLDITNETIYFSEYSSDEILCTDFDGSNTFQLVKSWDDPTYRGLDLDLINNKIYWVEYWTRYISCSNLDGSNIQKLIDIDKYHLGSPLSIAIGPIPEPSTFLLLSLGSITLLRKKRP